MSTVRKGNPKSGKCRLICTVVESLEAYSKKIRDGLVQPIKESYFKLDTVSRSKFHYRRTGKILKVVSEITGSE